MTTTIEIRNDANQFTVYDDVPLLVDRAMSVVDTKSYVVARCMVSYGLWLSRQPPVFLGDVADFWKRHDAGLAEPHPKRG